VADDLAQLTLRPFSALEVITQRRGRYKTHSENSYAQRGLVNSNVGSTGTPPHFLPGTSLRSTNAVLKVRSLQQTCGTRIAST
jgi:hypothetical protein